MRTPDTAAASNVQKIFFEVVDMQPAERSKWLDRSCRDDAELRAQVEELLTALDEAGTFLEQPLASFNSFETQHTSDTSVAPLEDDSEVDLSFLDACDKPDRLGKLADYEILEVVGRGGMGVVLRGLDARLNRSVSIKVLAPELATNRKARQRFVREAQAAAAIRHQNVVTIHAVDEFNKLPYLVMEFVAGHSLQQEIDERGPLETGRILDISRQIASGLAAAHAQNLVHRDIKPSNILLEDAAPDVTSSGDVDSHRGASYRDRIKITDFGLARAVDDVRVTQCGVVAGTPQYMSPEQALGERVDQRSDLFSLGSVMYAICTGAAPFPGTTALAVMKRLCEHAPRPIRELNPVIPDWLVEIVEKLLAKGPEHRCQSAREVVQLLDERLAGWHGEGCEASGHAGEASGIAAESAHRQSGNLAPRSHAREPARRRARKWWVAISLLATLLLAVLPLATVIYLNTGSGMLEIETLDPDVQVLVERGGELVTIIDKKTGKQIELSSGRYKLKLGEESPGLELSAEQIMLRRGSHVIVEVRTGASMPGGLANRASSADEPGDGSGDPRLSPPLMKPRALTSLELGDGPVKVFILAGDSNMGGRAAVSLLKYQASQPGTKARFQHLIEDGQWIVRDDVWIKHGDRKGKLTVGFGQEAPNRFGPELEFGNSVGNHFDEPVLIIKTTRSGPGSLFCQYRPPSAGTPTDEALARALTKLRIQYRNLTLDKLKQSCGEQFQEMLQEISSTLENLDAEFPEYQGHGYELAGFVWFQGWNDLVIPEFAAAYSENLTCLIRDVRAGLNAPDLPFIIGQIGVDGYEADLQSKVRMFKQAQAAPLQAPEFHGNVALVKTDVFWDKQADSVYQKGWQKHLDEWEKVGSDFPYHYLGSAKTFCQIGTAFGTTMIELCERRKVAQGEVTTTTPIIELRKDAK